MPDLASALYCARSARELDRVAIDEFAIPGIDLMERAGAAAWQTFARRWPAAGHVAVLCGPGNNGGDGFVVARHAAAAGVRVQAFLLGDASRVRGDAATALARLSAAGGEVRDAAGLDPGAFDAVVDALFGTGLARAVDGEAARLVAAVNAAPGARLALDVPSGLSADTGNALGTAVRADLTVTFIGLKRGLFTGDARDLCGQVELATLDVPDAVYARVPADARRAGLDTVDSPLGRRARRAHKGSFGHVLVVGGDHGFAGAVRLGAEAAARTGAGLTSVATRHEHVPAIVAARPELMVRGVAGAGDLAPLLDGASVVAAGPGLGRTGWATELLSAVIDRQRPMVLDADALNLLAGLPALRARLAGQPCVVTPHPGEAARLLGLAGAREVEADRFAAAQALCDALGCAVVLKGAGSVVQWPGGVPHVVDGGNPGMASGGMGDVLTGVIAALLAQGLAPPDAAVAGAVVHAAAGDAAAREGGERGLLAGDLLAHIRRIAARL